MKGSRRAAITRIVVATAVLVGLTAPQAPAAALELDGEVKVGVEVDTNPQRLTGDGVDTDIVERLFLALELRDVSSHHALATAARIGGKRFGTTRDEDTFVVDLSGSFQRRLIPYTALFMSLSGRNRTERGHLRDYARAEGSAGLVFGPTEFQVRVGPTLRYFLYRPDDDLSSRGVGALASVSWDISDVFSLALGYRYLGKAYAQDQLEQTDAGLSVQVGSSREDDDHMGSLSLGVQTLILGRAEAFVERNDSNSFGKAFTRWVVRLGATIPLPGELYLDASGSIQRTVFDEAVLIDPTFTVDDENRNSMELVLTRDLTEWLRAELRYSLYTQEFGGDDEAYQRQLVFFGLASSFQL